MNKELIGDIFVGIAFLNLFMQFVASYIIYPLYKKYGWFKKYYHDVCGHHVPGDGTILVTNHGLDQHAICKYCGKGIKKNNDDDWV